MMRGKKKVKNPEMDGGNTPDTTANEDGEASNHSCKKGTYTLICKNRRMSSKVRNKRLKHTESKLAKIDITKSGTVLKKQIRLSQMNPRNRL
jgi:hypothetical protein